MFKPQRGGDFSIYQDAEFDYFEQVIDVSTESEKDSVQQFSSTWMSTTATWPFLVGAVASVMRRSGPLPLMKCLRRATHGHGRRPFNKLQHGSDVHEAFLAMAGGLRHRGSNPLGHMPCWDLMRLGKIR